MDKYTFKLFDTWKHEGVIHVLVDSPNVLIPGDVNDAYDIKPIIDICREVQKTQALIFCQHWNWWNPYSEDRPEEYFQKIKFRPTDYIVGTWDDTWPMTFDFVLDAKAGLLEAIKILKTAHQKVLQFRKEVEDSTQEVYDSLKNNGL